MKVLFRLDISKKIGMGHFSRCLVLAEALANNNDYSYLLVGNVDKIEYPNFDSCYVTLNEISTYAEDRAIEKEWLKENQIKSAEQIRPELIQSDILVIDHYGLSSYFISTVKDINPLVKIVIMEDFVRKDIEANLLINPNDLITKTGYLENNNKIDKLLLGEKYSLVSSRFFKLREKSLNKRKLCSSLNNLLICFGGTDPKSLTLKYLEYEVVSLFLNVRIMISSFTPRLSEVIKKASGLFNVEVLIDNNIMHEQMYWADFMLGSPGGMTWERAILGLPSIVIPFSKNQLANSEFISNNELSIVLAEDVNGYVENIVDILKNVTTDSYQGMVVKNSLFCDGLGAERIALNIAFLAHKPELKLLTEQDRQLIWKWQNEPNIRRFFNNINPPSEIEHNDWFQSLTKFEMMHFYVICLNHAACGFIRLTKDPMGYYLVSILVSTRAQNLGLATWSLKEIKGKFKGRLKAIIMAENTLSIACFLKSGFIKSNDGYYYA